MGLKNYKRTNSNDHINDNDYIEQAMNKYKGFDEDMLVAALMQNLEKSKAEGTYDEKQLDTFVSMISPNLNEEQKHRLNNIIALIKSNNE